MSGPTKPRLEPLKISCTSSDCDADLHCFKATRELRKQNLEGVCRSCGKDLIDWERIHKRELRDANFTFEALKNEMIRHHFWHLTLDQRAINHALRKGRQQLNEAARKRLEKSVAVAGNPRDGRQTPFDGNALFYGQHATATCCRTCIEYWHGIPKSRDLTEDEVDYLHGLLLRFLAERLPDLPEKGQKVPPLRKARGGR